MVSIPNSGNKRKRTTFRSSSLCWRYLSSRAVTRKVLSAKVCLTSVFGMGTGGPTPQSTPTIYSIGNRASILYNTDSSLSRGNFGDPYRIRTDVNGVRGRCLNHLTNGPYELYGYFTVLFQIFQLFFRIFLPNKHFFQKMCSLHDGSRGLNEHPKGDCGREKQKRRVK